MQMKLSFLGAAENVTGSRYYLEVNGYRLLVDCGLYQERELKSRNWDPFPVPARDIDAVLLTHAHLDHCGLIPKLVKEGFKGKIYCTEATAEIAKIVLLDSGHIQEEDAEYKRKRHARQGRTSPFPVEALYTQADSEEALPHFSGLKYEKKIKISDNIEASFHEAGHILGASIIKVKVKVDGETRTILFTGDVGRCDKPILRDPAIFDHADYVLIESTYGDRIHEEVTDTKEKLAKAINDTMESGGNIVIPSFSIERSQEILYFLNELLLEDKIPHIMTFLDSPMAIKVTEVFKKHPELFDQEMIDMIHNGDSPFDFIGLKMANSTKESKSLNTIRGTIIIIAGSGMCTGGRVKHHLVNNIERPESTILFVGYQAFGTLGRQILDGAEEVRILGDMRQVKASIVRLSGFSAHGDQNELYEWISNIKNPPRKVFVVHGEKNAAHTFCDFLKEKTGWDVTVPAYEDSVFLD